MTADALSFSSKVLSVLLFRPESLQHGVQRGEHLFRGLDLPALGYRITEHVASEAATHVVLSRGPRAEAS